MKFNYPLKKLKLSLKAISNISNWQDYFADYFGMKKGDVIYEMRGVKIKTRGGTIDKSIFTEVALEELYFPKWLKLKANAVVVDVGAHIGIFSSLIAGKRKDIKVYSIEPCKENFSVLKEQDEINNFKLNIFNLALSNKKGKMRLYGGEHSARGSLLREEGVGFEEVNTLSLKEFFKNNRIEKCDLMKMDIEGGEYVVLYSTPKEIFDKIDKIFLELHEIEGESKKELMDFLKKMGFKLNFKEDDFIYCVK